MPCGRRHSTTRPRRTPQKPDTPVPPALRACAQLRRSPRAFASASRPPQPLQPLRAQARVAAGRTRQPAAQLGTQRSRESSSSRDGVELEPADERAARRGRPVDPGRLRRARRVRHPPLARHDPRAAQHALLLRPLPLRHALPARLSQLGAEGVCGARQSPRENPEPDADAGLRPPPGIPAARCSSRRRVAARCASTRTSTRRARCASRSSVHGAPSTPASSGVRCSRCSRSCSRYSR